MPPHSFQYSATHLIDLFLIDLLYRIRIQVLRIVSVCDEQVSLVSRASLDFPGQPVISLVALSLSRLERGDFVITDAWATTARDGRDVTNTHIRIVADQQM